MRRMYPQIIRNIFGTDINSATKQQLEETKSAVARLRQSYRNNVTPRMYDEADIRRAYMLGYYPHSVQMMKDVMQYHVFPAIGYKPLFKVSFLAGGPCPELIGMLNAIESLQWDSKLEGVTFDIEQGWTEQQHITFQLAREFETEFKLTRVTGCDIQRDCNRCSGFHDFCYHQLHDSDVIVIQNLLSHLDSVSGYLAKVEHMLRYMKPTAVVVIVDYKYNQTRTVLRQICENSRIQCIETNINQEPKESVLREPMPFPLKREIFNREANLVPRIRSNYYYGIFRGRNVA